MRVTVDYFPDLLSGGENDQETSTALQNTAVFDIMKHNTKTKNLSGADNYMIGTRLKLARLSNGLSLQDLSDILIETGDPITRAGLSKYETGKVIPNNNILEKIAKIMDLDISFFYKDGYPDYQIEPTRPFESTPKLTAEFEAFLQITLEQRFEIDGLLQCQTEVTLPEPITVCAGQEKDVCEFAQSLRNAWGIPAHPIASVVELLEDQGFYIFRIPQNFEIPCVAGYVKSQNRPFIGFIRTELVDDTRLMLTRELAYFFLRGDDPEVLTHMSHVFARAFLMPEKQLTLDVGLDYSDPTFWELTLLKQKYGISKVEIRRRLRDIGLLPVDPAAESLRRRNYISTRRKLDSSRDVLNFSESPVSFKLKVLLAYKKKLITRSMAASLLPKQYIQMNSWDG